MGLEKKLLGARGEKLAVAYLQSKNYTIIQRNFRAKQYGEVDVIAQKDSLLVFVEVKTRVGNEYGQPEEAVTRAKLHELKKMVAYYYNSSPKIKLSPQVDVIAITFNSDQTLQNLEHFENITL